MLAERPYIKDFGTIDDHIGNVQATKRYVQMTILDGIKYYNYIPRYYLFLMLQTACDAPKSQLRMNLTARATQQKQSSNANFCE